jgi:hypothetical protein
MEQHNVFGNMSYKKERRENESVLWCSVAEVKKIDVVCLFGYKVYVEGGNANVIDNFH